MCRSYNITVACDPVFSPEFDSRRAHLVKYHWFQLNLPVTIPLLLKYHYLNSSPKGTFVASVALAKERIYFSRSKVYCAWKPLVRTLSM